MNKTRILVVDDEPNIVRLMQVNLERQGYEVRTASNGMQAWQMLQQTVFDLVIADTTMLEMDGAMLEKRIRESDVHHRVPVLILNENTASGIWDAVKRLLSKRQNDSEE